MTAGTPYFEVHLSEGSDPLTLAATGELDAASAATLGDALAQAREQAGTVVLDLAGLTFIDSSGLRVVAAEHVAAGESGSAFRIVGATDRVRRIFEMTGLESLIEP
ncbi:MAG: STAS domain-containing protein [Acidimicrobiales bacterium]|nr:STAS domain-containing protein [Actinomycetota bacterium]